MAKGPKRPMVWQRYILLSTLASSAAIADQVFKTDGADLGITIMGAIVQKNSDDNVALIKEQSGAVKAVKRDYVILDKFKVLTVQPEFIELIDREARHYQVYQDKFAGALASKTAQPAMSLTNASDQYKEEGFERTKGKISMTAIYRDKLVKEDLAKVLMQATAEPYSEGGQIVGFKMSQIDEGSIYWKAGVLNGDIITSINGNELSSVAGSISLLRSLKGVDKVEIQIRRDGVPQTIAVDVH